jgi:hypothetical protein
MLILILESGKSPEMRAIRQKSENNSPRCKLDGGGRGIRTPGTLSGTTVFKTVCFNHSHIPPREVRSTVYQESLHKRYPKETRKAHRGGAETRRNPTTCR